MRVALLDVFAEKLQEAADSCGAVPFVCDVTDAASCQQAAADIEAEWPGVAISFLFNNAGINDQTSKVLTSSPEDWQTVFSVNVFGAVNILQAFTPSMLARPLPSGKPSRLVTTSSVVGLLNHSSGPYTASKMAVTAIIEQFSLGEHGHLQASVRAAAAYARRAVLPQS